MRRPRAASRQRCWSKSPPPRRRPRRPVLHAALVPGDRWRRRRRQRDRDLGAGPRARATGHGAGQPERVLTMRRGAEVSAFSCWRRRPRSRRRAPVGFSRGRQGRRRPGRRRRDSVARAGLERGRRSDAPLSGDARQRTRSRSRLPFRSACRAIERARSTSRSMGSTAAAPWSRTALAPSTCMSVTTSPSPITLHTGPSLCGNRQIDDGEGCDDGDRLSTGACDYVCQPRTAGPGTGGRGGAGGAAGTAGTGGAAGTGGVAGMGGTGGTSGAGGGGRGGNGGGGGTAGRVVRRERAAPAAWPAPADGRV